MDAFIIHYHEIALKKGNRRFFVDKLAKNIRAALKDLGRCVVVSLPGRLLLEVRLPTENVGSRTSNIKERLVKIPGIANFMSVFETPADIKKTKESLGERIKNQKFGSFRITTQRGDKAFPLTSEEVNRDLGTFVQEKTGARVDLKNPEFTVFVEILRERIFFSFEKIQGVGGLPVGSSGKVVSLLSGGIDSPVASFRMLTRGCHVVFVHFHSFPYLDISSQEKTSDLVKVLNDYQGGSKLHLVPFGDIQKKIVLTAPEKYRVIIYRRLMLRIAEKIAKKEGARALITGESLGQVASQTLENISVINSAVSLLVLRPLVGMGKEEIIKTAKKINTYDISILPDQDCCQLFMPKVPATKSEREEIEVVENQIQKAGVDFEKIIKDALDRMLTQVFFGQFG